MENKKIGENLDEVNEIKKALVASIDVWYKEHSTKITALNKNYYQCVKASRTGIDVVYKMGIKTIERTETLTQLKN